jgi:glutamine amidotransferase
VAALDVVVVDYEAGNLRSVARALEEVGARPRVSGEPKELDAACIVVLPGVGAGDAAMCALEMRGLVEPLRRYVASGRPFLGVCMGLQLLMDETEEGSARCLGIVPGKVRKLPSGQKVPHMGWNQVALSREHPVFAGIASGSHFYFVHSYYADPSDGKLAIGRTEYGVSFCSVLARGNLVATQFHPEKSGARGLQVYANFLRYAQERA